MRAVTLVLVISFVVANAELQQSQRIVGGTVTTIDRYPSMCGLLNSRDGANFNHMCGGSILNSRSVLTAAHCVDSAPANRFRVRVGSTWANSGGAVHNLNNIIIHPSYNIAMFMDADIAVVRTASTISFNNNVRAASIANFNPADNGVVWATGWGNIQTNGPASEQLRHVQVWVINHATCRQRYGGGISDNMLCIGVLDVAGRGQCNMDSGGPVYYNGIVVGVCSFGPHDCSRSPLPSVNVRVSRFTSWIRANA